MKLSDLRPCDNCNGPVRQIFYVVRFSMAFVDTNEGNEVIGLTQYFRGNLKLAETFAPRPECIRIAMDMPEGKPLMTELFICQECLYGGSIDLPRLAEKSNTEKPDQDAPLGAIEP